MNTLEYNAMAVRHARVVTEWAESHPGEWRATVRVREGHVVTAWEVARSLGGKVWGEQVA